MKFTNKNGLSGPMANALSYDSYSKGSANISVTGLLKSPRQRMLEYRHDDEIEVDVSGNLWMLLGRAVHDVLEKASKRVKELDGMAEERLYAKLTPPGGEEWTLSGQFDLLYQDGDQLVLQDYKVTGVFGIILEKRTGGIKTEWEQQLNIYRWLLAKQGFTVHRLEIVAIIRDWMESKSGKDEDYPGCPIVELKVPVWTLEDTETFILERLKLHQDAEKLVDDDLQKCSAEYRWERGEAWAVMEKGKKRATKVCASQEEAEYFLKEVGGVAIIEHRPGQSMKCRRYCNALPFCNFGKSLVGEPHEQSAGV